MDESIGRDGIEHLFAASLGRLKEKWTGRDYSIRSNG
jgi:hypothetical protein